MKRSFIISDNIISSLGFSTTDNFAAVVAGKSGIKPTFAFHFRGEATGDSPATTETPAGIQPDYVSLINHQEVDKRLLNIIDTKLYTLFEQLVILSISEALKNCDIDCHSPETLLVLSTAKGNIDLIDPKRGRLFEPDRIMLWKSAEVIASHFGNPNRPVVISNACISGTLSIIYATRMLNAGIYKNIIVCGCDIASPFIVAGFNCLKATDNKPCQPFDANRNGLNLGEGAATIILSSECPKHVSSAGNKHIFNTIAQQHDEEDFNATPLISIIAGASSNDANHISGPSRTGEGLYLTIKKIMEDTGMQHVDFVNAHGTGTLYNDEMESIAFSRCLPLDIPVNSFKGYFGHTLGASGVIETVLCSKALQTNKLIKTLGYEQQGTSVNLNITKETVSFPLNNCLKTSSGFGGTNASILLSK